MVIAETPHRHVVGGVRVRLSITSMVGLIEIAAGLLVAARPQWGGYVVGAWLGGIIVNLWTKRQYRDIALRDVGLALGALALARMAADIPRRPELAETRA